MKLFSLNSLCKIEATRAVVIDLISGVKHYNALQKPLMHLLWSLYLTCVMVLIYNEEQMEHRLVLSAELCIKPIENILMDTLKAVLKVQE